MKTKQKRYEARVATEEKFSRVLLLFDDKIEMARKTGDKQKENLVRCAGKVKYENNI